MKEYEVEREKEEKTKEKRTQKNKLITERENWEEYSTEKTIQRTHFRKESNHFIGMVADSF